MNTMPVGETGELYVGGGRVALGYVNDPRLSGEAFIFDPFASDLNARLYRTGDLAYELPDGNIQLDGRSDTRVKVDGYRVELTAIETLLETCDEVQEAVVVVSRATPFRDHLVGYVVLETHGNVTTRKLRNYLKDKLPMHMIPAVFVQIQTVPLTESGKVAREFLSGFGISNNPLQAEVFAAPDSDREKDLLVIWKQVMGLDSLGVDDNFFELGGHSLQATQISLLINEKHSDRINMTDVFVYPTVRDLSAYMENR